MKCKQKSRECESRKRHSRRNKMQRRNKQHRNMDEQDIRRRKEKEAIVTDTVDEKVQGSWSRGEDDDSEGEDGLLVCGRGAA